jgi:hypothetical protein
VANETAYATFLTETERMKTGIRDSHIASRVLELAARALTEKDAEIANLKSRLARMAQGKANEALAAD